MGTPGGAANAFWDGYKAQPWPAAAWSEMYRFEKEDKAVGLIYDPAATGSARWIDEEFILASAVSLASTTASAIGLLLAYSSF